MNQERMKELGELTRRTLNEVSDNATWSILRIRGLRDQLRADQEKAEYRRRRDPLWWMLRIKRFV